MCFSFKIYDLTVVVYKCGQCLHLSHAVNGHKLHPYAAAQVVRFKPC